MKENAVKKGQINLASLNFSFEYAAQCPACGESYLHVGEPQIVSDSHSLGYYIPLVCEICSHEDIGVLVVTHEGNTHIKVLKNGKELRRIK